MEGEPAEKGQVRSTARGPSAPLPLRIIRSGGTDFEDGAHFGFCTKPSPQCLDQVLLGKRIDVVVELPQHEPAANESGQQYPSAAQVEGLAIDFDHARSLRVDLGGPANGSASAVVRRGEAGGVAGRPAAAPLGTKIGPEHQGQPVPLAVNQSAELRQARRRSVERLYESLLRSAGAARWSHRPGRGGDSFRDVAHAAAMLPDLDLDAAERARQRVRLRNAAIAALALPDLRPTASGDFSEPWTPHIVFAPSHDTYAQADRLGVIAVRRIGEGGEQRRLAAPQGARQVSEMLFSADGRCLVAHYTGSSPLRLGWWEIDAGSFTPLDDLTPGPSTRFAIADGGRLIVADRDQLRAVSLESGQLLWHRQLEAPAQALAVSPSAQRFGVLLTDHHLERYDLVGGNRIDRFSVSPAVTSIAWHPDDVHVAVGTHDGTLRMHALEPDWPTVRPFQGHIGLVHRLAFSTDGGHLVSQAWDGTVRLWCVATGKQLMRLEGHELAGDFDHPAGNFLATRNQTGWWLWRMEPDLPLRRFRRLGRPSNRWSVDIDPSGRWVASATNEGIELWDVVSGELADLLAIGDAASGVAKDARFLPDGERLLISDGRQIRLVPLGRGEHGRLRFANAGTPDEVIEPQRSSWLSIDDEGRFLACRVDIRGRSAMVLQLADPQPAVLIGPHVGIDHVEISPDGRYVATTCWGGRGIHLWDARSGKRLSDPVLEPYAERTNATFSPDSRRLTAATPKYLVSWRVPDRKILFRIKREVPDGWPGPLAYFPDGRVLVAAHSRFLLSLLDAENGRPIALLDAPSNAGFHDCRMSRDGGLLAAASDTDLHLWDVRNLRRRLAAIGLDWEAELADATPVR